MSDMPVPPSPHPPQPLPQSQYLPQPQHPNAALLQSATRGFDYLFSNDIVSARAHFATHDDPFHLMGRGVCAFLEAALGMETGLMAEASRSLALSEAGTRREMRTPTRLRNGDGEYVGRFQRGLEWEILNADAVVLLGLTHALSESYMGYLQCMYSLNSAHSKFTKLYKTVFPNGLPQTIDNDFLQSPNTKATANTNNLALPAHLIHKNSVNSLSSTSDASSFSSSSSIDSAATLPASPSPAAAPKSTSGFFSRWVSSATTAASTPSLPLKPGTEHVLQDGPVEDLIVAGTAFGFGLFNLVFSLLPKKVQGVVGFLGFKHDRKLALRALALAATKEDVHGVFAGLVLMTYHGVVLLLSGYQADEERLLKEYKSVVDRIETRYPSGALWILNRAKIMRMSYDPEGAIGVLKEGLREGGEEGEEKKGERFVQADMLLMFELAWTLLGQRRYAEAADTFIRITQMNSWSHGTYYFIAAGCHIALGNQDKAQEMLDKIPELIEKKKLSGKDLPTEVFIKKKLAFWKEKQARQGGNPERYVEAVKINPAEEIGIFWNNHARVGRRIALEHVEHLRGLTPAVRDYNVASASAGLGTPRSTKSAMSSPFMSKISVPSLAPSTPSDPTTTTASSTTLPTSTSTTDIDTPDLDTPDEHAVRALLLGINYRTLGEWQLSRAYLQEAHDLHASGSVRVSTWVGGVAMFEMAVGELREAAWREGARLEDGPPDGAGVSAAPRTQMQTQTQTPTFVTLTQDEKKRLWGPILKSASAKLDVALALATGSVDLSSRLDSRIAMLRDEIATKRESVGC